MAERTHEIRTFILQAISEDGTDLTRKVASEFGITRQAVQYHLSRLMNEGVVEKHGETRSARYELTRRSKSRGFDLTDIDEDRVWREFVSRCLPDLDRNVFDICHYGLTEMVNNAIDHSGGHHLIVAVETSALDVTMYVSDDGVGVFRKIRDSFKLEDERHALLELTKGKLTTDPSRHTGEGIFFTSRAFDQYSILAGHFFFCHLSPGRDWLVEERGFRRGSHVSMKIAVNTRRTIQEVFDHYTTVPDDFGFSKTVIPVKLAQLGEENLISRSQAKRLLSRVDRFREVVLDFNSVATVGRAFVDEIFRVYAREHPEIRLHPINTTPEVAAMIHRALAAE